MLLEQRESVALARRHADVVAHSPTPSMRQDRRLVEGRGIEGAGGVGLVVLGEEQRRSPCRIAGALRARRAAVLLEQLLLQPDAASPCRTTGDPRGAKARYVSSSRSNFSSGLS